jgi:hypothetical protein
MNTCLPLEPKGVKGFHCLVRGGGLRRCKAARQSMAPWRLFIQLCKDGPTREHLGPQIPTVPLLSPVLESQARQRLASCNIP